MKKRTGVLMHSRHLQTHDWERIMWGEPPDLMGQLPKGILIAIEEDAVVICLGCGLRSGVNGEMESEFNRQYILDNFSKLAEFAGFQGIDLGKAKEKIEQILVLDRSSLNTVQEIAFTAEVFENAGIERVIGVTSRTHAPRWPERSVEILQPAPGSKIPVSNVLVYSSDTGWAPNSDVMVFEPPHMPKDLLIGDLRQKVAAMLLQPDKLLEIKKALNL